LKLEASTFNNRTSSRRASDARKKSITYIIDPQGVAQQSLYIRSLKMGSDRRTMK